MPNDPSFRTTRRFMGPPWLVSEGESRLIGYALDLIKDAFAERLRLGLLARYPSTAPADALPYIGRDRRVVRGINETIASYVARLIAWLDDRKTQGNPFTLLKKLHEYTGTAHGCSFRTVDARGNWFSRAADGTETYKIDQGNWNWNESDPVEWFSRFWVIIYPGTLWTEGGGWDDPDNEWGSKTNESQTWGSTATPDQVSTVRSIVADWMPGHSRCINIILAFDPASFDPDDPEPDGLWEHSSKNVGGVQVPARLQTARYWDGVVI